MRRTCIIILLLVLWGVEIPLRAQQSDPSREWPEWAQWMLDEMVDGMVDEMAVEMVDEMGRDEAQVRQLTDMMEELEVMHRHPMDINVACREDLERLPFLSPQQVMDIMEYVARHAPLHDLAELQMVPSLGMRQRSMLGLFVYAGDGHRRTGRATAAQLWRRARHELRTRADVPLLSAQRYSDPRGYMGNRLGMRMQYSLTSMNRLSIGLNAERDRGERGLDSHGGHVMLSDMGWLRRAVVGDYKIGFGEGLVLNQGISMGRQSMMERPMQGIRRKLGTDEVRYMRGAAATVQWGAVQLTALWSTRRLDATLDAHGCVTTLLNSGYHRTASERARQANTTGVTTGAHVAWQHGRLHLGGTGYMQWFDRLLLPGDAAYRRYYPRGQRFGVMSLEYAWNDYRWSVRGETAYSTQQRGWATINRATYRPDERYTLTAIQRLYTPGYYSFYSAALSQGGRVQNEQGLMLRLEARPLAAWLVDAYADVFRHPTARYQVDHPSRGYECQVQSQYTIRHGHVLQLRYQVRRREQGSTPPLHHRLRLTWRYAPARTWTLTAVAHMHALRGECGWAGSGSATLRQGAWRLSVTEVGFRTPSWQSRLSMYESGMVGAPALAQLYGTGARTVVCARYAHPSGWWTAEAKAAYTGHRRGTGRPPVMDVGVQLTLRPWAGGKKVTK